MSKTDSFALVHFPHKPAITADEMVQIEFDASKTTVKTPDVTYEGHGTKSSDLCGLLGFVDDQGHVHLTSNFDVYTMRPKLTDFHSKSSDAHRTTEESKLNASDLKKNFASEKERRSIHSKERNTFKADVLERAMTTAREQVLNASQEQLNESANDSNASALITLDDDDHLSIPKPNYDAQKPEEVFHLDDILTDNDLLLLSEKSNDIVDTNKVEIQKWAKEGTYSPFVCDQMKKLPTDHAERVRCASKILYLHYLIVLFKRSMFKRLSGKPFPDDAPRALHDKALQTYAIANINERTRKQDNTVPPRLRLKLTAHICILSLHICRYTVDIDSLRLALGSSMALSKLQDIFSELGCRLSKVVQTSVASLDIPVQKPKPTDALASGSNRKRKRTS